MTSTADSATEARAPLSEQRVLQGAIEVADDGGIGSLTMRNLAHHLGVEAMSLYYHVANKEALLDGVVEVVVDEINQAVAEIGADASAETWKDTVRRRILAARQVLLRHPWAPAVLESRTKMSRAAMRYFDDLLGILLAAGLSMDLAHHGLHALGSRALGFSQELFQTDGDDAADEEMVAVLEQLAQDYPNIVELTISITHDDPDTTLGACDDQFEFEFALDLILDGLERLRRAETSR